MHHVYLWAGYVNHIKSLEMQTSSERDLQIHQAIFLLTKQMLKTWGYISHRDYIFIQPSVRGAGQIHSFIYIKAWPLALEYIMSLSTVSCPVCCIWKQHVIIAVMLCYSQYELAWLPRSVWAVHQLWQGEPFCVWGRGEKAPLESHFPFVLWHVGSGLSFVFHTGL